MITSNLQPFASGLLTALCFLLCSGWVEQISAEEAETYIILSAQSAEPNAKQPTRIGLIHRGTSGMYRSSLMPHIDAGALISAFPAGTYAIDHVDFDDKLDSESQKRYARDTQLLVLKEGKINFVGTLVFTKTGWNKFSVATGDNDVLLENACKRMPNVFKTMPVTLVGTDTEFFYSCD